MEKKYILTDETITLDIGIVVHRIKAIRSFNNVNEGDLGGWIEKEDNLSHDGNCWIYNSATVCCDAYVYGNAKIYGDAIVCDNATVFDNAEVYGDSYIYGHAKIYGNANLYYKARVYDNAEVFGDTYVYDHAHIYGNAIVFGSSAVYGNAKIYGDAYVYGHAKIYDNAWVFNNARVCGYARVCGNAEIHGNAVIQSDNDYIVFKNWWSSGRYFTWTRSNNMWRVGCFYGTGDELIKKAYTDSEISGREYEKIVKYVENILKNEEK